MPGAMATYTVLVPSSVQMPVSNQSVVPTLTVVLPDVGVSVPVEVSRLKVPASGSLADIVKIAHVPEPVIVTFRMAHALWNVREEPVVVA